jgi:hypothetical protein
MKRTVWGLQGLFKPGVQSVLTEISKKRVVLMLDQQQIREFNRLAIRIRIETIRQIANLGIGHIGGTLSLAEVLAVLYGGVMERCQIKACA